MLKKMNIILLNFLWKICHFLLFIYGDNFKVIRKSLETTLPFFVFIVLGWVNPFRLTFSIIL